MKWLNIPIEDSLHYEIRNLAARHNLTIRAVVILALEAMLRKQEEKERAE